MRDILKIYRESDKLVFLLNDADLLHGPSAALILKSLEDTKQSIIFVLTAKESSQVIYTIYSRCVCLEFNSLKEEDIKEYLQVKYNIWNDHYAKISNGSFKMADDLASGSYLNNRNIVWSFLNEVKFINEDELAPPELLKENPELFVSIGLNLLYDVIKMSNGQSYSIINADLEDEYRNWLDRYSSDFAIFCIICFRDILRDIHKFYNLSLHLKTLILKLRLGSVPI
ncbi:hypothetical protein EBS02_03770 [bacterium]|nr:hypothetical protein [bacterium]